MGLLAKAMGLFKKAISRTLEHQTQLLRRFIEPMESRVMLSSPVITSSEFVWTEVPHRIVTTFNEDVSGLTAEDFEVVNLDTDQPEPVVYEGYEPLTHKATLRFPGVFEGSGMLASGNYQLRIRPGAVSSAATGEPMLVAHEQEFFFLWGDADHNRVVDASDYAILDNSYVNQAKTFPELSYYENGDFDYSTTWDATDYSLIDAGFMIHLVEPTDFYAVARSLLEDPNIGIRVSWDADPAVHQWRVERNSYDGNGYVPISGWLDSTTTFYDDSNLADGTWHSYRVRGRDTSGNLVAYTPHRGDTTVLPAPTIDFAGQINEQGDVLVEWTSNSQNHDSFVISRYVYDPVTGVDWSTPDAIVTLDADARSYTFTDTQPVVEYYYRVAAEKTIGLESSASLPRRGARMPTSAWTQVYNLTGSPQTPPYVQATWSPALPASFQNQTVTLTLSGLPRHTYAKVLMRIVAWGPEGYPQPHVEMKVGGQSIASMDPVITSPPYTYYYWYPSNGGFKHESDQLTISLEVSNLPEGWSWTPELVDVDTYFPFVRIAANPGDRVATLQEGTPVISPDPSVDPSAPGFWIRRDGNLGNVSVRLKITGDATAGQDYTSLPEEVVIPHGQQGVFLPVYLTEDLTPEYTESIGVTVRPMPSRYVVLPTEDRRAAIDIVDDDYWVIGFANTPSGEIPTTEYPPGTWPSEGVDGELAFTDPLGDPHLIAGAFDDAFLPWALGREHYLAAGGSPANPSVNDLLSKVIGAEETGQSSPEPMPGGEPGVEGNPVGPSNEEIGRNLAILEENRPGFAFTYDPAMHLYVGTDAAGRVTWFNLNLTEVRYWGTGKMWYLRYNDDGSIDRVQYRYGENDPTVYPLEMSARLKQEILNSYNRAIFEQQEEDAQRIARLGAFKDALAELIDGTLRALPGAIVLDAQEALTGENALRPGMTISGGQQAASAASMAIPGMLLAAKRAAQMIQNAAAGMKFENEMRLLLREVEHLDVPARKRMFTAILNTGRARRTFPDVVIAGQSMIEIKRVQSLTLTPQLEAQIKAAEEYGLNYRIIVSDVLDNIADPLKEALESLVDRPNGRTASIEKYDSIEKKLVKIWP